MIWLGIGSARAHANCRAGLSELRTRLTAALRQRHSAALVRDEVRAEGCFPEMPIEIGNIAVMAAPDTSWAGLPIRPPRLRPLERPASREIGGGQR
jgi:hypothetical protein